MYSINRAIVLIQAAGWLEARSTTACITSEKALQTSSTCPLQAMSLILGLSQSTTPTHTNRCSMVDGGGTGEEGTEGGEGGDSVTVSLTLVTGDEKKTVT